jgi:hypothetical protein
MQISTRQRLSPSRTAALRVCAIVFEMNWKTGKGYGEKNNQTNQPDPPDGNIASEQAD